MNDTEYYKLVRPYEDAMNMLLIRVRVVGHSLYNKEEEQLYHTIQSRIKGKDSIENKLEKKKLETSVKNAKDYLRDIAGIRVICLFREDIYRLVELLTRQSDLFFIKVKDYMDNFPVEVQFRTMEMYLWASMEHRILYKNAQKKDREKIKEELRTYSEKLREMESYFKRFR